MGIRSFRSLLQSRLSHLVLVGSLCLGILGVTLLGHVGAASVTYKGITLTPAVVSIDLLKGQQMAKFTISVTNNTTTRQTLHLSTLDFRSLSETGGIAFVGSDVNQVAYKYGLASWLDISKEPIDLPPHATKEVALAVENRADLAPGGHYAAVLFSANTSSTGKNANHVAINQVVSSLIFVGKLDGAKYGINLDRASIDRSWLHLPTTVNLVFRNPGNIQEVPRGLVTVTSPFSHEIARGIINSDSNLMLPDSRRLYQVKLSSTGRAWWPGIYHVSVSYRYDGTNTIRQGNTSFWYVSPLWLIIVFLIAFGVWLTVRRRKTIRRFLRHHSRLKRALK